MEMSQLSNELRTLGKGECKIVYRSENNVEVTVTQTGKHSKDDFAVGLTIPNQVDFRPTHIRLLIDLYIKRESNEEAFKSFFQALEEVYIGKDTKDFVDELRRLSFPMHLDEREINI